MNKLVLILCLFVYPAVSLAGGATEDIIISDAVILPTTEGQKNTAAYMRVENDCRCEDHSIVSAYSPVAEAVALQTQVSDGGIAKMRPVDEIDVTANSLVVLKPGDHHLLLMGLKQVINEGDSVPITLEFDDGSTKDMTALAKNILITDERTGGLD